MAPGHRRPTPHDLPTPVRSLRNHNPADDPPWPFPGYPWRLGHSPRSPTLTPHTIMPIAVIALATVTAVASFIRTSRTRRRNVHVALMQEAERRLHRFKPATHPCKS